MSADYYSRDTHRHIDGSPVFATPEDTASEDKVALAVGTAWRCSLKRFGALSPVDWYAIRDGRLCGVAELKTRSHESSKYPTVFLNVRKWLALRLASVGLGVPAIFLVQFTDQLKWCRLDDIDATKSKIGGCSRIVKSQSDIEPVIEVAVSVLAKVSAAAKAEVA